MKKTVLVLLCIVCAHVRAQEISPSETHALYSLTLKCIEGGVFAGQEVAFKNVADGSTVKSVSGADGKLNVLLPINCKYELQIKNF